MVSYRFQSSKDQNKNEMTQNSFLKRLISGTSHRSKYSKLAASLFSIIVSLIFAIIIISAVGKASMIGEFFKDIFIVPFFSNTYRPTVLSTLLIYIFAGLAVAFAFRAGLFNIGVSGQMIFGGGLALIIALKFSGSLGIRCV